MDGVVRSCIHCCQGEDIVVMWEVTEAVEVTTDGILGIVRLGELLCRELAGAILAVSRGVDLEIIVELILELEVSTDTKLGGGQEWEAKHLLVLVLW